MNTKKITQLSFSFFLLIFLLSGCAFISLPLFPSIQPLEEKVLKGTGKSKILIIDISGFISESEKKGSFGVGGMPSMISRIKEELDLAQRDSLIKGVILKINSPGGTVTASDIIYNELMTFKKKVNVPIVAVFMGVAASGGYYIASSADTILAHPTTITGSIGVIAVNFNLSELMNKIGIKDQTVKSGKNKDLMSPFRPSNPHEKEIMLKVINTLHERFVQVVAGARDKLSLKDVKKIADGRIYTAPEALKIHLIDKIGYIDDAVALLNEKAGIIDPQIITYTRPFTYRNNIYAAAVPPQSKEGSGFNLQVGFNFEKLSPKFLYLWRP